MDLFTNKIFALMLTGFILLMSFLLKNYSRVWYNPGSIFCLFWFILLFIPLMVVWGVNINLYAIFYILLFCLFFSIPVLFYNWSYALNKNREKDVSRLNSRVLAATIPWFSFTSCTLIILGTLQQGFSINDLFNIVDIGGAYAKMRYREELNVGIFTRLGLVSAFGVVILGGLLWGSKKFEKRKAKLILYSFSPFILIILLQSAKGQLFLAGSYFIGGILISNIFKNEFKLLSLKQIKYIVLAVLTVLILVTLSFLARGLSDLPTDLLVDRLRMYFITYTSGHLFAFADWFDSKYFTDSFFYRSSNETTYGFYTFMSFFQLFGDTRFVPLGTYDEFYEVKNVLRSNIYTSFRGYITDFTLIGSLLYSFCVGNIVIYSFYRLLVDKLNIFAILMYILFIGFTYHSYLISSFTFLSIPFIFILLYISLTLILKVKIKSA